MKFIPTEVLDRELAKHILKIDDKSSAMEVFRIYDEITLMRHRDAVVSYRIIEALKRYLNAAMLRDNMTQQDLNARALWRDQDF